MTKNRQRGPQMALGLLTALALTAAACGSDKGASTSDSGTGKGTETAASAGGADAGEKIVVSLSTDVNLLEEHLFRTTGSYAVTRALYQPFLDQEYVEEDGVLIGTKKVAPSTLEPRIEHFMGLIFDDEMFKGAMASFDIDVKKMPLGQLSIKQVQRGYDVLTALEKAIKGKKRNDIMLETSRFYTVIPHAFGLVPGSQVHHHLPRSEG